MALVRVTAALVTSTDARMNRLGMVTGAPANANMFRFTNNAPRISQIQSGRWQRSWRVPNLLAVRVTGPVTIEITNDTVPMPEMVVPAPTSQLMLTMLSATTTAPLLNELPGAKLTEPPNCEITRPAEYTEAPAAKVQEPEQAIVPDMTGELNVPVQLGGMNTDAPPTPPVVVRATLPVRLTPTLSTPLNPTLI